MIFTLFEGFVFSSMLGILFEYWTKIQKFQNPDRIIYKHNYTYSPNQTRMVNAMAIYTTCKEPPFPAHRMKIPSMNIKCNLKLNHLLCKEALPMLDFFIDYYYKLPAKKLIFIHGHERSWHYRKSVIDVVNDMIKSEKFWKTDYGALYDKICWHGKAFLEKSDGGGPEYKHLYKIVYANTSIAKYLTGYKISYPCCATFYINSSLITDNPISLYKTVRERLINWTTNQIAHNKSARICSYFMEYTWNVLLNRPWVDRNTSFA